VLVRTSDDTDLRWGIYEVDVASGAVSSTGARGRFPDPDVDLQADLAEDAGTAAIWTGDPDGVVTLVDVDRGRQVRVHVDRRPSTSNGFLPLATGVAQLWADGAVTLYDTSGRSVQVIEVHHAPVQDVVVSPHGTWGATAGDDGVVVLWDIDPSTGRWSQRELLTGHDGNVVGAEVDPAGRLLFTVSVDGTIIAWNMTPDAGFGSSYPGLGDRWIANRPQMVDPGRLLVAPTRPVSGSDQVERDVPNVDTLSVAATFLDPATGRVVDEVVVGDTVQPWAFGSSVAVSPDRRKVAVTSGIATTVLDTRTREVLGKVVLPPTGDLGFDGEPSPAELVWSAGWTPDGSRLLLGAEGRIDDDGDGGLVVVNPSTWKPERRVPIGAVQAIEASPDRRLLAAASEDLSQVQVLDGATLEVERTVPLERNDWALDLSFSPDGRRLAFGGELGLVYVLDTATWRPTHAPGKVHDERLGQVEWMPDGRTVITSGSESVSLFDVTRGLVRGRPLPASSDVGQGHTHLVPGTTDEIIALSGERAGRRYPMEPSRWLAAACTVAGRDLTRTEWSRYVPDRPYQPTCSDLS
jgi:WD40 repeat protein